MKNFLCLITGFIVGCWLSWPGIIIFKNWKCFFEILDKSFKDELSFKAIMSVSPKYLLKGNNNSSRIRIISDSCFR